MDTAKLRDLVRAFVEANDIPGAAAAVVKDGAVAWEEGFGLANVASGASATPHTLWPICSVTKSFTAVAAMQLVEAGKLRLDEPVRSYLPDFRIRDEAASKRLSTRMFLRHSSGLGRSGHQDRVREEAPNPFPTRASLVAGLADAELQSEPDACYSYCNEGYATVGHLIETLAGMPLEDYFQQRIFDQARLADSSTRFSDWRNATDRMFPYMRAAGGPFDSGERHGEFTIAKLPDDYQTFLSTGGIVSTAHDLAKYQIATMSYTDSPLGLSAGALDHMHSVQFPYGDTGWGYGFGYWVMWSGRTRLIGHAGGLPGVSTYSLMAPAAQAGVVVLTNRGDRKPRLLAEQLLDVALGCHLFRTSVDDDLPYRTAFRPDSATRSEYAGAYRRGEASAEILLDDDGLLIRMPPPLDAPQQEIRVLAVGRDAFVDRRLGDIFHFVRGEDGQVARLLAGGYAYDRS